MTTKKVLLITISINLAFIILGLIIGNPPEQYFSKEGTYITWVSFIQLLVIANLSLKIFKTIKNNSSESIFKSPALIWGIIALGFFYLATDEVIRIHENLDNIIHRSFHITKSAISDRLDDAIVAFYGLIGIFIMFLFKNELLNYKKTLPLFMVGFLFFFLMTIADMSANRQDVVKILTSSRESRMLLFSTLKVMEEGFKLFAEALFISAFFNCLTIARNKTIK